MYGKKTDSIGNGYTKNLIPVGRLSAIRTETGEIYKIFHEYDRHANDALYNGKLVVFSWGILKWNEYGKFYQQVGKYYTRYGNAVRKMLKLAKI